MEQCGWGCVGRVSKPVVVVWVGYRELPGARSMLNVVQVVCVLWVFRCFWQCGGGRVGGFGWRWCPDFTGGAVHVEAVGVPSTAGLNLDVEALLPFIFESD